MKFAFNRILISAILATSSMIALPSISIASEINAEEAAKRLNIAARQRMLSQRISMTSCFVNAGVHTYDNFEKLEVAFKQFDDVHNGLLHGNAEMGLHQEEYRHVVEALEVVDEEWDEFSDMIEGFMMIRLMTPSTMVHFDEVGLDVLSDMDFTVTTIANTYSANLENLPQILALTINFAGRQRMLTQKIAKEYCLISTGVNIEANLQNLRESNEQFNLTLQALEDGIPRMIAAAPTPEIMAKLKEVEELWERPNALIESALAGDLIMPDDRRYLSDHVNVVLSTMNDAVTMYQELDGLANF